MPQVLFFHFLKNIFKTLFYLAERERKREREAGSPLSKEPDAGLDPRTLGS